VYACIYPLRVGYIRVSSSVYRCSICIGIVLIGKVFYDVLIAVLRTQYQGIIRRKIKNSDAVVVRVAFFKVSRGIGYWGSGNGYVGSFCMGFALMCYCCNYSISSRRCIDMGCST
jgi:hypothetical protein